MRGVAARRAGHDRCAQVIPSSSAAAGEPLPVSMLEDQLFLIREPGSGTREVGEAALAERGIRLKRTVELGSTEAIKETVAAGLGLAIVSRATIVDQTPPRQAPYPAGRRPGDSTHLHAGAPRRSHSQSGGACVSRFARPDPGLLRGSGSLLAYHRLHDALDRVGRKHAHLHQLHLAVPADDDRRGIAADAKAIEQSSCGSCNTGTVRQFCPTKLLTIEASSPALTASTTNPCFLVPLVQLLESGISAWHGGHHVAHALMRTGRPA